MSKEATETDAPAAEEGAAPAKAPSPWLPIIAVAVLMPGISFAVTQFVLLPKIKGIVNEHKAMEDAASGEHGHAEGGKEAAHGKEASHGKEAAHGKGGKEEKGGKEGAYTFDFQSIVVNLSGSMGTRYLKTSFTVYSANKDVKRIIEENKNQMLDTALGVLGSRSLADLEQPGAKNVVRNDLMANFNQALKSDLIEQIYFSEFVVQ